MKIVVLDGQGVNPGDISWKQIEQFGTLTVYPRTDKNDVLAHVGDAEIVLTNKTVFDASTIDALTNTRYIGVLATGYNVVDTEASSWHRCYQYSCLQHGQRGADGFCTYS